MSPSDLRAGDTIVFRPAEGIPDRETIARISGGVIHWASGGRLSIGQIPGMVERGTILGYERSGRFGRFSSDPNPASAPVPLNEVEEWLATCNLSPRTKAIYAGVARQFLRWRAGRDR